MPFYPDESVRDAMCTMPLFTAVLAGSYRKSSPILFALPSVNQIVLSGPAAMNTGPDNAVGIENSVIVPLGVMRPILFVVRLTPGSVKYRLPSGPVV
jgi:hypothetical protein